MKRKKLWLSLLLVVALLAAWFEPTRCVRGVLRGEPFYDGRPASWWAAEWEHLNPRIVFGGVQQFAEASDRPETINDFRYCCFFDDRDPEATPWKAATNVFSHCYRHFSPSKSPLKLVKQTEWFVEFPAILRGGDPAALPVLQALERHDSPKIRLFAQYGIKSIHDAEAKRDKRRRFAK